MDTAAEKQPWIETSLIWSRNLSRAAGCNIYLKLENNQPSGSFKSRGMGNFVKEHLKKASQPHQGTASQFNGAPPTSKCHFFCSSGGNAGLGVVCAAVTLGCPATIVVPTSTSDWMIEKIRLAGANDVIQKGASWFEADKYLNEELLPEARKRGENAVYVPPFDAPEIWAGHSTMVDEIVRQLPAADRHYPTSTTKEQESSELQLPDAVICSVGGGGLLNGIMQGLARYSTPQTHPKVVAVETVGADSLAQSIQKGELITLPKITSIATTLGARTVSRRSFEYAMDKAKVTTAVLTDAEAVDGCRRFANDERILVEPSCGVSLGLCYSGKLADYVPDLRPESKVVVVVCGGSGLSLDILANYIKRFL